MTSVVITNNYKLLLRTIDPTDELLNQLSISPTWSARNQIQFIKSAISQDAKCGTLLNALRDLPSSIDEFVAVLRDNDQDHAANIFTGDAGKVPMSEAHLRQLQDKQNKMRCFIDSTGGLLDELIGSRVFTHNDADRVKAATISDDMAMELIRIMQRKSDCAFQKFVKALNDTGHNHVVYILTGEGDERPLADIYVQRLTDTVKELAEELDLTNGLLEELVGKHVLSSRDIERVKKTKGGQCQQCTFLIALIQRKSQTAYDGFVAALKKN